LQNSTPLILTRRDFVRTSALTSGALLLGMNHPGLFAVTEAQKPQLDGKPLEELQFLNEGRVEMDSAFGSELDGRLYTSLSGLSNDSLVTPMDRFYVRTRASQILPRPESWAISLDGLVAAPQKLKIAELQAAAKPLGLHLMECAGNTRAAQFGMISVGEWTGVPISEILSRARAKSSATQVLVSGFDRYVATSTTSTPGASWIFPLAELAEAGAFLATRLNSMPLTRDHGAPVRLVIPNWYGCACIKWVQTITLVDQETESTSQMREFASRTGQKGVPDLARDFSPAIIQLGAMPIRIEKRRANQKIHYRVVGLCWGGSRPATSLFIRFNPEEDYVPVQHFRPATDGLWTVWTHDWFPARPGKFLIRLMTKDVGLTQRINSGYFVREVEIEDV